MSKLISMLLIWMMAAASVAFAQDAPLGLAWSASAEALKQAGVDLKEMEADSFGKGFEARKLSKALADQESTFLSLGNNDKLWRIVVISKEFANDPMGIAIKRRYKDILDILTEKYGQPKSHHTLGDSIYSEPKYFLAGIRGGNSFWYSDFSTSDVDIQIGIFASTSSEARWRIIYEYKPLRKVFDQSKRGREKSAL